MYVTVVRIPAFGDKESKEIIGGLTKIRESIKPDFTPGFIQSILLREEKKGAMLVTLWESRQHLQEYIQTDAGKRSSEETRNLIGTGGTTEAYNTAWQAISGVPLKAGGNR